MWLFCGIKASSIVPPIHCVDGEKRIYYSMHKYQVVEQAPISYFFKEIDKTLKNYQSLIESRNADRNVRGIIKQDWIINCVFELIRNLMMQFYNVLQTIRLVSVR
jgi:hypothetical protein